MKLLKRWGMFDISEIPMFSGLPVEIQNKIKDKLFVKRYKKNSIVFFEGDTPEFMYIVLDGSVKMYKTTPKGNQVHINILKAPSLIGEYVYFEEQPFPATCEFAEDGAIGLLPFEVIEDLLDYKSFTKAIIKSLTGKVMLLSALVHKETILSSEAKVADILVHKPAIFQRLKNSEIASILNLTPETFSRILAKFKRENIAYIKNRQVELIDKDKLYQILETNKVKECTNCIAHFKEQYGIKE